MNKLSYFHNFMRKSQLTLYSIVTIIVNRDEITKTKSFKKEMNIMTSTKTINSALMEHTIG